MSEFRMHNGLSFERQANGDVLVRFYPSASEGSAILDVLVPAIEWCSLVAAVGPRSGIAEEFHAAKQLHGYAESPHNPTEPPEEAA